VMGTGESYDATGALNDAPDTHLIWEDRAFGGAGLDILIGNTGGDRLIDWAGEFNSYIVPFAPFGLGTVSRTLQPQLGEFLYALSASDGADLTRGGDAARNGEPFGELGMVRQQDFAWRDQTGAPDDPQPGNIPGGARDVLRSAAFDDPAATGFFTDSGSFTPTNGELRVTAASSSGDAVSVFHVGDQLPIYFELQASIKIEKPTAGWKGNAYVIFDYQSPTDFKFAGINVSTDKIEMGHRTSQGWIVDVMAANVKLRADTNYNMLVAVNGLVVTVTVNNSQSFSYAFAPRLIDGVPSNLNWGYIGFGSQNSKGKLDNVQVKVLERPFTLITKETFDDGVADLFTGAQDGDWQILAERYFGAGADPAMSLVDLGLEKGIQANARTELGVTFSTAATAGFVFDLYSTDDFKFVLADTAADRIFIGHRARGAWIIDASAAFVLNAGQDHRLVVSLAASTVSVMVDDMAVVGHAFNAVVVDGAFGTMARGGAASFDDFTLKTSDSRFKEPVAEMLVAASAATVSLQGEGSVGEADLAAIVAEALARWSQALGADVSAILGGMIFAVGDLDGGALAQTVGNIVIIDTDAAGHGWFIDATPWDDKEFSIKSGDEQRAASSSAAYGRIDLLTVVMHEIGHLLGFTHDDPAAGAVMDDTLATGVRRLPPAGAVAPNGNESVSAGNDTQHVSFNSSGPDSGQPQASGAGDEAAPTAAESTGGGVTTDEPQLVASASPATTDESAPASSAGTVVEETAEPAAPETTSGEEETAPVASSGTTQDEAPPSGAEPPAAPEPAPAPPGSHGKGRNKA